VVAYPYIPGSGSDAFKGVSVFAGLMISLGSAGLVNQVMSGLVVVYSRACRVGDYVKVGETEGTVSFVGVLSTKIVNWRHEEVTIPNALLVGHTITNYTRLGEQQGAIAMTAVTIGYDAPWRQVHALLEAAAARTRGVRKEPGSFVLQRALSDFFVEYQLHVYLERVQDRVRVLSELHAAIQDAFNEAEVQIMSPHFLSQPAEKVFSPRAQWHAAPSREDGQGVEKVRVDKDSGGKGTSRPKGA
jgi:small-conductance mechanosensitive channel